MCEIHIHYKYVKKDTKKDNKKDTKKDNKKDIKKDIKSHNIKSDYVEFKDCIPKSNANSDICVTLDAILKK